MKRFVLLPLLSLLINVNILSQATLASTADTSRTLKAKAIRQFDASVGRFKRCLHGKCTKVEALKAARDVGIAAVAAVTALYLTGIALQKGAKAAYKITPGKYLDTLEPVAESVGAVGAYMQKPAQYSLEKTRRVVFPFRQGDRVSYRDYWGAEVEGTVKSYDPIKRLVLVRDSNTSVTENLPAKNVTLKKAR